MHNVTELYRTLRKRHGALLERYGVLWSVTEY